MTLEQLIALGAPILNILIQIIQSGAKVDAEIFEVFRNWWTLLQAKISGVDITEEQVTDLAAKVDALAAANLIKEQAIIDGKA